MLGVLGYAPFHMMSCRLRARLLVSYLADFSFVVCLCARDHILAAASCHIHSVSLLYPISTSPVPPSSKPVKRGIIEQDSSIAC